MDLTGHLRRLPARPKRWAKRGLLALAIAYVAYVVAVNVALSSGLVARLISGKPEEILVTFDSAWSFWPGHLHARGLQIRGADSMLEWKLTLDDVSFRHSMVDLTHRRFRASHIRGKGVSMRIRMKLDRKEATPETVSVLPPIDGFSDPPLKPTKPPAEIADADYRLWSAQLEDIEALSVREMWFDAYRFTGDAHVTGNFALRPVRLVTVAGATVDVSRGELRLGKETMIEGLHGALTGSLVPFDPRTIEGAQVLRYMSVTSTGQGRMASLRFLNHYFPAPSQPKFDGGEGSFKVDLRIAGGVMIAPTHVISDSAHASMTLTDHRGSAASHIVLSVEPKDGHDLGQASIELTGAETRRGEVLLVRAPRIGVVGTSTQLDLVTPFGDATVAAEVPEAIIPEMRAFNPDLKSTGIEARSGSARLHTKVTAAVATHTAHGDFGFTTDGLAVRKGPLDVRGAVAVAIKLNALNWATKHADLSGSRFEIRDVVIGGASRDPGWWGRAELEHATVAYSAAPRFSSTLALQAKDGRPFLAAYAVEQPGLPSWAASNLTSFDALRGMATISASEPLVEVRGLTIKGGDLTIHADLQKRGPALNGAALITSGPFAVGVELTNGKTSLKLFGATDWYRALHPASGTL